MGDITTEITRVPEYDLEGFSDKKRAHNAIEVDFTAVAVDTDVEVSHELGSREPRGWELIECKNSGGDVIACGKVYKGTDIDPTSKDPKIYINLKSDTQMVCKLRFI